MNLLKSLFLSTLILVAQNSLLAMGGHPVAQKNINRDNTVLIYYIPFSLEIPYGITTKNIEAQARNIHALEKNNPHAILLKKIFSTGIKSTRWFEDGYIRLKIVGLFKEPVYMDEDHGYLIDKTGYILSKEDFQKLQSLLDMCTEVPSIKECK